MDFKIDKKKLEEIVLICARTVQDYVAYVLDKKVDEVFKTVYDRTLPTEFKNSENKKFKLDITLVNRTWMFPVEELDTQIVKDRMSFIINGCVMVYNYLQSELKENLDEDTKKCINRMRVIWDPSNTTMLLCDMENPHKCKAEEKRVGFIWR
jgi:hypothetical protein